jgi:hypothetical protein
MNARDLFFACSHPEGFTLYPVNTFSQKNLAQQNIYKYKRVFVSSFTILGTIETKPLPG